MVELQPSKLVVGVRFSPPAPCFALLATHGAAINRQAVSILKMRLFYGLKRGEVHNTCDTFIWVKKVEMGMKRHCLRSPLFLITGAPFYGQILRS